MKYIRYIHTLIKGTKKWRPRRHSSNQPRKQPGRESKDRGRRGGIGGGGEGRRRKELIVLWKKISRAWIIGSTKAMRTVGW